MARTLQKETWFPKKGERNWVLFDLDGEILGRAATRIANVLRGKHKVTYTPHMDMGDFVIAVNASKVRLSGNKLMQKVYYRHSGYKGGLKITPARMMLEKKPEELIRLAVRGMLPKNKTQKHLLRKLKIYAGPDHPHEAQVPKSISLNDKGIN